MILSDRQVVRRIFCRYPVDFEGEGVDQSRGGEMLVDYARPRLGSATVAHAMKGRAYVEGGVE